MKKSDLLIYIVGHIGAYGKPFEDIGTITTDRTDLTGADLIVFTGGEDVTPSLYGADPGPFTVWNWNRDMVEKEIFEEAKFHGIRMTGICRGLQFLHVMNGGHLHQHIEGHPYPGHNIITDNGDTFYTNTFHHQACCNQPDIMSLLAMSYPDNVVEAAFYPTTNCFGVQYHPEMMDRKSRGFIWYQERVKELLGQSNQEELIQCALH